MPQLYLARHLRHLVDPITRTDLAIEGVHIVSQDETANAYPVQNGILRMFEGEALDAQSLAYDETCRAAGWTAPDEFEFRMLPRTGLPNWSLNYWKQRSLSTAAVWGFIEQHRRANKANPLGFQGVAASLSNGLPYMAYGLDAAGYMAFALSPHAGRYALGVQLHSRYARVQTTLATLPLKPNRFDLITIDDVLAGEDATAQSDILRRAAAALKDDGHLLITDMPDADTLRPMLVEFGLNTSVFPARDEDGGLSGRIQSWLGRTFTAPPMLIAGRKL